MANNKRRTNLVDSTTQWAIVRQSLVHWFYHSLVTILLLAMLQWLLGGMFKSWAENWQAIWPLAASVYVSLLLLLPLFILNSFKLSNRFAGPVGRVRDALRGIAEGKPYSPIHLRDGDFWPEIAQELNAAVEKLTSATPDKPPRQRRAEEEDKLELSAT
jgi:hypothetical protein